jgi:hypothetical protein
VSQTNIAPPTRADFDAHLGTIIEAGRAEGRAFVDVTARALHDAVGGYPALRGQHRMPQACAAMQAMAKTMPSEVLYSPPSGQGASLSIRYFLSSART